MFRVIMQSNLKASIAIEPKSTCLRPDLISMNELHHTYRYKNYLIVLFWEIQPLDPLHQWPTAGPLRPKFKHLLKTRLFGRSYSYK